VGPYPSTPALKPSKSEQDERYDERTDRVLDGDVIVAPLKPGEKRRKASRWDEQYMAATARNKTPRSPAISGTDRFMGRTYTRITNFPSRYREARRDKRPAAKNRRDLPASLTHAP
jgi:hypothetical protein